MHIALNWLTQGVLVALATAAVLRAIPRSRARARYGVLWIAYLQVLILPLVALLLTAPDAPAIELVSTAAAPVVTVPARWWMSPALAIGVWMVWACVQSLRLGLAALAVRRARRCGRECPAPVLARLPHWSRVSGSGRPVTVILSTQVRAAAVLGMGRATIALAPALIGRLTADDLDRVLVHEWAHVQRRDDLAQLAQRIIRIVIGWHPAAWWLERRLEFEREAACDAIAVCVTGSAKRYAACLATLAVAVPDAPRRPVAALGALSASRFRQRLVRILAAGSPDVTRRWRAITLCAGGALLASTAMAAHVHLVRLAVASPAAHPPAAEAVVRQLASASPSAARTQRVSPPPPAARQSLPGQSTAVVSTTPPPSPVVETAAVEHPATTATTPLPLEVSRRPVDLLMTPASAPAAAGEPRIDDPARAAWTRAADFGVDVGRVSQRAGTTTAGFFSRFGKKVADVF